MKHWIMLVAMSLAISACAFNQPTHQPATLLSASSNALIIEQPATSSVAFHNVRVEHDTKTGQFFIKGDLRRIRQRSVRFGHIDYRITMNGKLIQQGKVDYGSAIKRRLTRRHSPFSIRLTQAWQPTTQQIRLRWDNKTHTMKGE
ncbi:MAG: hypothetical protein ACWA5U_05045 [bacterium]